MDQSNTKDILETIKDCLFIGDSMLNTDDAMVTNQKNHLIKLADERSSQLQFITKAMSGFAKQKEVTASFASTEKDEKQILHKIVEFNNSQLKSKESERNRDNLISENLKTMRKDLGNVDTANGRTSTGTWASTRTPSAGRAPRNGVPRRT
jgi:ATP-dependent Lon protease